MFNLPHRKLTALLIFLCDHADALQYACQLIGGQASLRRMQSVLDSAVSINGLTRRDLRELRRVLALLRLEPDCDAEREVSCPVSLLDPADPCLADIALLAEGLLDAAQESGLDFEAPCDAFEAFK